MSRSVSASEPDAQDSTARDIAVDVAAEDLVHLGTDGLDRQHYHDRQRGRIIVTETTHDDYTRAGSARVRRRLVASHHDVAHVIADGGNSPADYVRYVRDHTDVAWVAVHLQTVDLRGVVA
jgi:hypothetical protein